MRSTILQFFVRVPPWMLLVQARAARGMFKEAIKDLTKAAELGNVFGKDHDVFHQRGLIHVRLVLSMHVHCSVDLQHSC